MKWGLSLPKSSSRILTNFATTANFGKKGGKSRRKKAHSKQHTSQLMKSDIDTTIGSQSIFGEKGGEVRKGPSGPMEEKVIWQKETVKPIT